MFPERIPGNHVSIEKPFPEVHSEIGGGGYRNSRILQALEWMIAKSQAAGAPFNRPNEKNYPDFKQAHGLEDNKSAHDSRYWFMDRVPFTRIGRNKRGVFGNK